MTAPPLIGTDELVAPSWVRIGEEIAGSRPARMLGTAAGALRTLARLAWRASPRLTALAVALGLASGCVTSLGLLATTNVFAELLAQAPTPARVVAALPAVAMAAAAFAARGALEAAVGAAHAGLAPRVEQRAHDELHASVVEARLVAFDDPDFIELVRRSSVQGILTLREGVTDSGTLLGSLVSLTASVLTAGLLNPLLAPVVLLAAAPHGWACMRAARLDYQSFARSVDHIRRRAVTSELITGRDPAAEIRAYTAGRALLAEHRRINARLTAEAIRVEHRKAAIRLLGRGLAGVGGLLAYGVLGALLYTGAMPLALAGAAAIAMRTATASVATTVLAANRLFEHSFYLDMFAACLAGARRYRRRARRETEPPLPHAPELIELRGVSFTYPGKTEPALRDVSLSIARGQVVALVGENGSGKTTLAKLIIGLYAPDEGQVTWDGIDIADVDPDELHSRVALIPQSPTQWPMTAENNIRIGRLERRDPDRTGLAGVAAVVGADSIVASLPDGWDTLLSRRFHRGSDLSGGQWQRISAARGLYRDAPLLIADEPASALDARAEHTIFRLLHTAGAARNGSARHRTTLLITHRLANVRAADHIVVLHRGRVAEQGTHEQLIAGNGIYAELVGLQETTSARSNRGGAP